MAKRQLPRDFRDFLKLLNENEVEYLLIGGYAVAYHGYPRSTYDMDVWVGISRANADRMVKVIFPDAAEEEVILSASVEEDEFKEI